MRCSRLRYVDETRSLYDTIKGGYVEQPGPGQGMKQREEKTSGKDSSQLGDTATTDLPKMDIGKETYGQFVTSPWGRRDLIVLFLIVLAAVLLRLVNLDYMQFEGDEANNLAVAADFVSGRAFPLVGIPSSIGTYFPPLFTYLMAIPLMFSRNPVIAAGFVALVNCASVGLCYVFCRRYFGEIVAIVAAGFFAVNPWAVFYTRKIWPPDLLPLFVIGFFFSLFAVVCEGRRKYLLICSACFAAATQLHLSTIYFLVIAVLTLVWFRPKVGWGTYLGGVAIAFSFYVPYLVFDLFNRGYDTKIYLHALSLPSRFHPEALIAPFIFGSTLGFMHFMDWPFLDLFQVLLVAMGMVYLFFHRSDPRYAILLLWCCVPSAFLLISKLVLFPHYFICFYPIQFVLAGIMANTRMHDRSSRKDVLRYVIPALFVVLAAYQMLSSVKFVGSIAGPVEWKAFGLDYGPSFRSQVQEIRELAREGVVEPEAVQRQLLQRIPPSDRPNYYFSATKYIVENLNAIR